MVPEPMVTVCAFALKVNPPARISSTSKVRCHHVRRAALGFGKEELMRLWFFGSGEMMFRAVWIWLLRKAGREGDSRGVVPGERSNARAESPHGRERKRTSGTRAQMEREGSARVDRSRKKSDGTYGAFGKVGGHGLSARVPLQTVGWGIGPLMKIFVC